MGERLRSVNEQVEAHTRRMCSMESNRAALPKPPAYARGRTQEQQKALGLLSFERLPATAVQALFAQLRELGVSCRKCSMWHQDTTDVGSTGWCPTYFESMASADAFYCNEWKPTSPPAE